MSDEAAVSRVGEALNQTLGPDINENATPRDHFSPVQVRFPVNAPALRPLPVNEPAGPVPIMPAFEDENGVDDAGALKEACTSLQRLEWDDNDLGFFFNKAETRMKMGV